MTLTFHWFLPTSGDSRGIVGGGHGAEHSGTSRTLSHSYLRQLALAAETNGFESVLTPTGAWCEDAWLTDASLIEATERLKFLVALRPGQIGPTLSAQMASTFQRLSNNRLLINVVTGGEDREQRAYGDFLNKDERYARCGEFLDIVTRLWRGETVNHHGEHLHVEGAKLTNPPAVIPEILFGGSSPAAGEVASSYADTYLTWGETPDQVAEKINWINGLASQRNRNVGQGIRFHVITRDTSEEAWAVAEKLIEGHYARTGGQGAGGLCHVQVRGPASHGATAWQGQCFPSRFFRA